MSGVSQVKRSRDRRVPPEAGGDVAPVALEEELGASRVVGDGDQDLEAPRRAGQRIEVGEQRRPPRVVFGRQERVDQRHGVADRQSVARDLLGARPVLRVRAGPALDAGDDLLGRAHRVAPLGIADDGGGAATGRSETCPHILPT